MFINTDYIETRYAVNNLILGKSRKGVLWVRRRRNLKNRKITAMCMVRDIIMSTVMNTAMNTSMSRKRAKGTVMSIITLIPMNTAMNIIMSIAMSTAMSMVKGSLWLTSIAIETL